MPNKKFWKNRRVFVTGHTGFKGSWLTCWLQQMGANITGYALPAATKPSMFKVASIAKNINTVFGDIRDLLKLKKSIKSAKPDIVIHMAAQAIVKLSYLDPIYTYSTNVIGTMNILEAVRDVDSVRAVVCITSDKCYENMEWVWGYRENDILGGRDPYSSSKACAELLIAAYHHSFFSKNKLGFKCKSLASVRAGNVIGGGDWSNDRLIPDIIRAIARNKTVKIRHPAAVRPWQFVLEPLRGYLDLAERLFHNISEYNGAWNFGPDIEQIMPVEWIVKKLIDLWGHGANWKLDTSEHPHENNYLKLDCTKAKALLNWKPVMTLPQTIEWIVDWYKSYFLRENMLSKTEYQIQQYERMLEAD